MAFFMNELLFSNDYSLICLSDHPLPANDECPVQFLPAKAIIFTRYEFRPGKMGEVTFKPDYHAVY